jgi:hypothetical protein
MGLVNLLIIEKEEGLAKFQIVEEELQSQGRSHDHLFLFSSMVYDKGLNCNAPLEQHQL